jgi:hypothetical protein
MSTLSKCWAGGSMDWLINTRRSTNHGDIVIAPLTEEHTSLDLVQVSGEVKNVPSSVFRLEFHKPMCSTTPRFVIRSPSIHIISHGVRLARQSSTISCASWTKLYRQNSISRSSLVDRDGLPIVVLLYQELIVLRPEKVTTLKKGIRLLSSSLV